MFDSEYFGAANKNKRTQKDIICKRDKPMVPRLVEPIVPIVVVVLAPGTPWETAVELTLDLRAIGSVVLNKSLCILE